jgi:predicted enzyme related to lactoylglutathione lyase
MRIRLANIFVDDQRAALAFYTEVLGFVLRNDVPLGNDAWLTVGAPDDPDGPELLLEPTRHHAVRPFRDAMRADGIPVAQFAVDDVHAEHARLVGLGVEFTMPPWDIGSAIIAVFDDTCGNLIQIISPKDPSTIF